MVSYNTNMTTINQIKCPGCTNPLNGDMSYCPECGTQIPQKPVVSTGTKIGLIITLILIFPIGLIATLATFWGYKKEMDRWRQATGQSI
jgi:uncharacterized paraquat-inducible protein A